MPAAIRFCGKYTVQSASGCRPGETAAPVFPGDRFVCFLLDADEERIEALFSAIRNITEENLILHFSAGVYVIKDYDENINLMVDKASVAAQTIKGVLNQHVVYYSKKFDDMTAHNEELKRDLKLAIKNDEFVAFYQLKLTSTVVSWLVQKH